MKIFETRYGLYTTEKPENAVNSYEVPDDVEVHLLDVFCFMGEKFNADIYAQRKISHDFTVKKHRLTELSNDIVQSMAGVVIPDIADRMAEFVKTHGEMRALLNKPPRETGAPLYVKLEKKIEEMSSSDSLFD